MPEGINVSISLTGENYTGQTNIIRNKTNRKDYTNLAKANLDTGIQTGIEIEEKIVSLLRDMHLKFLECSNNDMQR